ncbi:hypothetical protein [Marinimicrobium alkaliphilum]|uniref:hypothetical protein n=1 Tax=Marinimicrobium alkaliphilum TaxID=2202654 RepID=UPI000DB97B2E|nr:hypothetical protein [Marinimicrobium alkaliphilum]
MRIKALLWCSLLVAGVAPSVHGEGDFTAFEREPDPLAPLKDDSDVLQDVDWSNMTFDSGLDAQVPRSIAERRAASAQGGLDALPYAQGFTTRLGEPTILLLILLGLVLIALARWRR